MGRSNVLPSGRKIEITIISDVKSKNLGGKIMLRRNNGNGTKGGCGGCLSSMILVLVIMAAIGGCHDDSSSSSSSATSPKTHLTSKQKAKQAEKRSIKKVQLRNEKGHLSQLREALTKVPDQTKNAITSAKLGDDNQSVTVTLNDEALEGSNAQTREDAKDAWELGTELVQKYSPYPDGDIDGDDSIVYVEDSAGNELGKSSVLGGFKWEG